MKSRILKVNHFKEWLHDSVVQTKHWTKKIKIIYPYENGVQLIWNWETKKYELPEQSAK
jgi:hypothetical protein